MPDRKIDPYAGVDVRGKVVVAHGPRALPKGVDIQQLGRVSVGATPVMTEAHQRGAVAVAIVPQSAALTGWEAARSQNLTRRELEPWVPSAYAAAPFEHSSEGGVDRITHGLLVGATARDSGPGMSSGRPATARPCGIK